MIEKGDFNHHSGCFHYCFDLGGLAAPIITEWDTCQQRSPQDFADRGTYEVVKTIVAVDIDTAVHFEVDESWE